MLSFKRVRGVVALACLGFAASCQSTGTKQGDKKVARTPPLIAPNMPLDTALLAAVDFGGDTLTSVKKLIKRRQLQTEAFYWVTQALHKNLQTYEHNQLINAGHLYASMVMPVAPTVFRELVRSGRPLAQQLGWQLAAVKPSPALAQTIDAELTRAIAESDEESVLIPQMANAVKANHLTAAYTLLRQGLMSKGDEEFALGMMALNPQQASDDFIAYLAQPPAEELRQLTMSTVNLYTCIAILKHMQRYPADLSRAGFDHLFFYAVSRNPTLADLAHAVLETYVPHRTDYLAQSLARQQVWIQMAYLEGARRRMNPKQGLLLSELKKTTSENDVVQEINEIRF